MRIICMHACVNAIVCYCVLIRKRLQYVIYLPILQSPTSSPIITQPIALYKIATQHKLQFRSQVKHCKRKLLVTKHNNCDFSLSAFVLQWELRLAWSGWGSRWGSRWGNRWGSRWGSGWGVGVGEGVLSYIVL